MTEPKYQTFWPRFRALTIDCLLLTIAVRAVGLIGFGSGVPVWFDVVWYVFSTFSIIMYFVVMHALWGQTLGKMVNRIRLLDLSESKLSARQALFREIVPIVFATGQIISGLPSVIAGVDPTAAEKMAIHSLPACLAICGWFAAQLLTLLLTAKRRAVHDYIAGSVVVRESRPRRRADALFASSGLIGDEARLK